MLENDFNTSTNNPIVEKRIQEKLAGLEEYKKKIIKRVDEIVTIHESIVIVEKIDIHSLSTWLAVPENNRFDRIRLSFYGRVLKISDVDSGDSVQEAKKRRVAIGDIVSFNPDSAYSLNINIPDKMPEIWVIAVDNILMVDKAIKYDEAKEKSVRDATLYEYLEEKRRSAQMADFVRKEQKIATSSNFKPH